jgi:hypothetical protein
MSPFSSAYLVAIAVTLAGLGGLRALRGLILADEKRVAKNYLASRVAYMVLTGLVWWLVVGAWALAIAAVAIQAAVTAVGFVAFREMSMRQTPVR